MGSLIVVQRVPAFIITLGGLLVFKGLHWLTIRNQTVPIVEGGSANALLAADHVLPAAGRRIRTRCDRHHRDGRGSPRARARRRNYGLEADDRETTFLKLFALAQLLLLVVLVTNQYRGVPLAALILGGVALGIHILTSTRRSAATCTRSVATRRRRDLSGVPIRGSVIGAFAIMGLVVALTGFMQTAYSGASTTTVGSLMELDAIAACVIGGVSLRGGRGTVLGVLFGALIMASLLNGMTLMAVSPEIKFIARGLVLAVAVWLDVRLSATE